MNMLRTIGIGSFILGLILIGYCWLMHPEYPEGAKIAFAGNIFLVISGILAIVWHSKGRKL